MNTESEKDPVRRLSRLDSCAVSDALDKLGLRGAVTGILPLSCSSKVCGRAVTVKLVDAAKVAERGGQKTHLCARAIEIAEPGDVIVVEQRSGVTAGSWGGILSTGAKLSGVAGIVSEGLVRDVDEARALGFPIYARGATALTARGRVSELETGGPVQIGDIAVNSGDYVIADGTAVVFVGADVITVVLDAAEQIAKREAAMGKALMQGKSITAVMGADYEEMLDQ